jgi:hypothetical protein
MPKLSVTWRRPVYRVRAVIIIVIYLGAYRLAPHDAVPLAAGSVLGALLAAEPARERPARSLPGSAR